MGILTLQQIFTLTILLGGVAVYGQSRNCPPETPWQNCTSNPCDFPLAICIQDPTAQCRPDSCGGCIARFYDQMNREVHCEQDVNVICELKNNTIGCQAAPGTVMKIRYANYGRRDIATCPHPFDETYDHYDTRCHNVASTTNLVRQQCEGQTSCHLRALNAIYGDACPGTYKYLEVDYTCDKTGASGSERATSSLFWTLCITFALAFHKM